MMRLERSASRPLDSIPNREMHNQKESPDVCRGFKVMLGSRVERSSL